MTNTSTGKKKVQGRIDKSGEIWWS